MDFMCRESCRRWDAGAAHTADPPASLRCSLPNLCLLGSTGCTSALAMSQKKHKTPRLRQRETFPSRCKTTEARFQIPLRRGKYSGLSFTSVPKAAYLAAGGGEPMQVYITEASCPRL